MNGMNFYAENNTINWIVNHHRHSFSWPPPRHHFITIFQRLSSLGAPYCCSGFTDDPIGFFYDHFYDHKGYPTALIPPASWTPFLDNPLPLFPLPKGHSPIWHIAEFRDLIRFFNRPRIN